MTEKRKQDIPMSFKLDDFFTTQDDRDDDNKEKIEQIDISLIDSFTNHPFKIIENEDFKALQESIKINGILSPTIVRKKEDGKYEMISGHRRKYACQLLGINSIPCIIKELSDDQATIYMVDSNLQREKILPSEKAYAYKLSYEAMKHQGKRSDLTSGHFDQKSPSEIIAEKSNESEKTVRRFIRLTYLIPKLLEMVDNSELGQSPSVALSPAQSISYLSKTEQQLLSKFIETNLITPSVEQAKKLKELSKEGNFNEATMIDIMNKEKPNQVTKFKIQEDKLYKVLPQNIKREKIEDFILKACSYYTERLKRRNMESSYADTRNIQRWDYMECNKKYSWWNASYRIGVVGSFFCNWCNENVWFNCRGKKTRTRIKIVYKICNSKDCCNIWDGSHVSSI